MKLTAQVKLLPTPQQAELLRQTLEQANAVCKAIGDYAWEKKIFRACGFSGFADHIAAINIGRRAASVQHVVPHHVNRPYVSDAGFSPPPEGGHAPAAPGTSYRLSAGSS